eukprot:366222-Chlamydomonas_euryale.AAC.19
MTAVAEETAKSTHVLKVYVERRVGIDNIAREPYQQGFTPCERPHARAPRRAGTWFQERGAQRERIAGAPSRRTWPLLERPLTRVGETTHPKGDGRCWRDHSPACASTRGTVRCEMPCSSPPNH